MQCKSNRVTDGANAMQKQHSDKLVKCYAKKQQSDRWGKMQCKSGTVLDGANAMQKQHGDRWGKCNAEAAQ